MRDILEVHLTYDPSGDSPSVSRLSATRYVTHHLHFNILQVFRFLVLNKGHTFTFMINTCLEKVQSGVKFVNRKVKGHFDCDNFGFTFIFCMFCRAIG